MLINCSENCIYQNEGICTLKHVTNSSGTPSEDCPYFREKVKKVRHEESSTLSHRNDS